MFLSKLPSASNANRFPAGAADNYLAEGWQIPSNITIGAFRAPRFNFNAAAEQSFLVEVAEAAGNDPIAFRLELLKRSKEKQLAKAMNMTRIAMPEFWNWCGFTLNETAEFLTMIENKQASCGNVFVKISEKVPLIGQKIMQFIDLRTLMQPGVQNCLSCCTPDDDRENCPMLTTDLISEKM